MRAKHLFLAAMLYCTFNVTLFAQPEQHTGKLLRNIRSYNQEKFKRDNIQSFTSYNCGEYGDKKITYCEYNKLGQLIDSIGYPDPPIRELFQKQLSLGLKVDSSYIVDDELVAYRYRFLYNKKGLRIKTEAHIARPSPKYDLLNFSDMMMVYMYDSTDKLVRVTATSPAGIKVQEDTYTYDNSGNVIEWKQFKSGSPRNFTCKYTFDERNNLTEYYKVDAAGDFVAKERNTFDVNGNLKSWEDISKSGVTLYRKDFTYDSFGNMVEALGFLEGEEFDSKLQRVFDANGNITQTIASRGRITYAGDFRFRDVFTENFSYNESGTIIRVERVHKRFRSEHKEEVQYDESGNIVIRNDSEGGCVAYAYAYFE